MGKGRGHMGCRLCCKLHYAYPLAQTSFKRVARSRFRVGNARKPTKGTLNSSSQHYNPCTHAIRRLFPSLAFVVSPAIDPLRRRWGCGRRQLLLDPLVSGTHLLRAEVAALLQRWDVAGKRALNRVLNATTSRQSVNQALVSR